MMEIKVLGSGCANCKRLLETVKTAVKVLNVIADIHYVTDYQAIAATGIIRTPGLIVNHKIVSYGRVPTLDEVKQWIVAQQ
jgi:small redox-active disulfide protein 2